MLEIQEIQVWSLGQEDPLKEEMATHSSIPARIIQWREEPGGQQSTGLKRGGHNWTTEHAAHRTYKGFPGGSVVKNLPDNARASGLIPGSGRSPGEGNGNPLQYSCLGNPMDRGAWRAIVHGITKELDVTWQPNNNIKCTRPRVSANVNCELWVITMGQCRFINCNVCTAPEGGVDNEGSCASVGERVTQEISLIFLSICLLWKNKKQFFECPASI